MIVLSNAAGMPAWLEKEFPDTLAQTAKSLLTHKFDLLLDAIDVDGLSIYGRFLVCIARLNNEEDSKWLKEHCTMEQLNRLFHWLIQKVPQNEDTGSSSRLECSGWTKVDNSKEEIGCFPTVAGLEFIFGMRTAAGNYHARLNVYLETGECVGQMIVFSDEEHPGNLTSLMYRAVEAIVLVRRVLPEIRQARYMDAILSGGEGGDLEHILIRYLPALIPLTEFYVRNITRDVADNWSNFFSADAAIAFHRPAPGNQADNASHHFKGDAWNGDISQINNHIKTALADRHNPWDEGFVHWTTDDLPVLIAFSTIAFGRREEGVAVLAVSEAKYLSGRVFNLSRQDTFDGVLTHQWHYYDGKEQEPKVVPLPEELFIRPQWFPRDDSWRRFLRTQLRTTLAVVLEPRHPLRDRLTQAEKEGKAYREQYGTAIYGPRYLNLGDINDGWNSSDDLRAISHIIAFTEAKLTHTLYEPRGFRAIARVIFDRFFCPLWKHFRLSPHPERSHLWTLVRQALDFEDTLRLEASYREHFVHSYHVFLLGLYIVRQLKLTEKFTTDSLKAWFLVSMYHDIAYPIQKMKNMTTKYLDKLTPSMEHKLGDDIAIDVTIGFGRLIASDLLGARLRVITDSLVDALAANPASDTEDPARKEQVQKLTEYLRDRYHQRIDWMMYKQGMQHTFYQYCLSLAIKCGEHGIIKLLLIR